MILLDILPPMQIILMLLFLIAIFIFPLVALIDVLINQFPGNDKITWVVVIIFLPFLGALLYYLIGRRKRLKKK